MIINANWGYPVFKQPRKWMPCEPPPSFSCMIIPPILTQPHSWCLMIFPLHSQICWYMCIIISWLLKKTHPHFQISFLRSQKWLLPHVGIGLRPGPSAAAVVHFYFFFAPLALQETGDRGDLVGSIEYTNRLSGVNIPFLDLCSQLKSEKRIKKGDSDG